MVVDDEVLTREVLAVMLDSDEVEVHTAGSGPEALELARRVRPSVVLLDLMMPGMDGFSVCRGLRENPETRDARVVVVSARDDAEARRAAAEVGADAFLVKPYSARDLYASVEGHGRAP